MLTLELLKIIEEKWRLKESLYLDQINNKRSNTKKKYVLSMLPYPSGKLHLGHIRNYTIGDVMSRYYYLNGYKIINPMGWDAFGLPAERAAIENGIHPQDWTLQNIKNMKNDLMYTGNWFNWNREINTCDIKYYQKQQAIFLAMYKKGWLVKKEDWVNWDPIDETVLANEQVDANGFCWRSGAKAEKKLISQWFLKISDFTEELLEGLKELKDKWPDKVINMQKNWIGKSEGYNIKFNIENSDQHIIIFTTKPETIFGCTFVVIAAESHLAYLYKKINHGEFVCNVIHPITQIILPVFIANYVLYDYGTGYVMGVPSCDERDKNFAIEKNLPVINIIDDNENMINSFEYNGLNIIECRTQIELKFEKVFNYRLKDWCVSRQRYWGCPIPIIYCEKCGIVEAPLPVILPYDVKFGKGNPLCTNLEWCNIKCPKCGIDAKRETDTLDTFFDSSWYFLEYLRLSDDNIEFECKLLPIDLYIGGIEHAILHLLYARFMFTRIKELGYITEQNNNIIFDQLVTQGMICLNTYKGKISGKYYEPKEIETATEEIEVGPYEKMSKSKKNIIQPYEISNEYGISNLRGVIISNSPIDIDLMWTTHSITGFHRLLQKTYIIYEIIKAQKITNETDIKIEKKINELLFIIDENISSLKLNLYISNLFSMLNILYNNIKNDSINKTINVYFKKYLICLWLIAPLYVTELYDNLYNKYIGEDEWPKGYIEKNNYLILYINNIEKRKIEIAEHIQNSNNQIESIQNEIKKIFNIPNYKSIDIIKQDNNDFFINIIIE